MRIRESPLKYLHVCNLLTYLSILSGIAAYLQARDGSYHWTGLWLATSAVLDVLDGKFARLFKRTEIMKKFGAELDSLADAFVFGIVPFLCALELTNGSVQYPLFLVAGFFHILCNVTRLGFFNVFVSETHDFTGVPTTIIGMLWSLLFYFEPGPLQSVILFVVGGIAMVSPVQIRRPTPTVLIILILMALALMSAHLLKALHFTS